MGTDRDGRDWRKIAKYEDRIGRGERGGEGRVCRWNSSMAGKHKTDAGNNASRSVACGKIATWLSRHMHFSLFFFFFFAISPRLIDRSYRPGRPVSLLSVGGNIPGPEPCYLRVVPFRSRKIRPAVRLTDRSYLRMLGQTLTRVSRPLTVMMI